MPSASCFGNQKSSGIEVSRNRMSSQDELVPHISKPLVKFPSQPSLSRSNKLLRLLHPSVNCEFLSFKLVQTIRGSWHLLSSLSSPHRAARWSSLQPDMIPISIDMLGIMDAGQAMKLSNLFYSSLFPHLSFSYFITSPSFTSHRCFSSQTLLLEACGLTSGLKKSLDWIASLLASLIQSRTNLTYCTHSRPELPRIWRRRLNQLNLIRDPATSGQYCGLDAVFS